MVLDCGLKKQEQQLVQINVLQDIVAINVKKEPVKKDISVRQVQAAVKMRKTNAAAEHTLKPVQAVVQNALQAGIKMAQVHQHVKRPLVAI